MLKYLASYLNSTLEVYAQVDGMRTPEGGTVPLEMTKGFENSRHPDIFFFCRLARNTCTIVCVRLVWPGEEEAAKLQDQRTFFSSNILDRVDLIEKIARNRHMVQFVNLAIPCHGHGELTLDCVEKLAFLHHFSAMGTNIVHFPNYVRNVKQILQMTSHKIFESRRSAQWDHMQPLYELPQKYVQPVRFPIMGPDTGKGSILVPSA